MIIQMSILFALDLTDTLSSINSTLLNMGFYRDYLKENSKKADLSSDSTVFIKIREMYDKKIRRFKYEIIKQYESILPKPQELAQLQKANYSLN